MLLAWFALAQAFAPPSFPDRPAPGRERETCGLVRVVLRELAGWRAGAHRFVDLGPAQYRPSGLRACPSLLHHLPGGLRLPSDTDRRDAGRHIPVANHSGPPITGTSIYTVSLPEFTYDGVSGVPIARLWVGVECSGLCGSASVFLFWKQNKRWVRHGPEQVLYVS